MRAALLLAGWLWVLPLAPAGAETLNLLIWEEYIASSVIETWTARTGVEIRQIYFDNGDERDRLLADPNSNIDLATLNDLGTAIHAESGTILRIDETSVPSIVNSAPRWRDQCRGHAVPYFWGTLGIVYREDELSAAPRSWKDLLVPAPETAGHIAMFTGYEDLLAPALILAGKSVSSEDPEDLKAAFAILKAQAPAVKSYDYVITSAQDPKDGAEIHIALAYSGDQFTLSRLTGKPWRYALPREGGVLWVDCLVANAHSPRKELALKFLDFMNQPEIAAENAAHLRMPTTNLAAISLLPEDMRSDPQIFPPDEAVAASSFYREFSAAAIQLRKRIASSVTGFHDTQ